MTPPRTDHQLKQQIAKAIFMAIFDNAHFGKIEGLYSIDCQIVSPLNLQVRVRQDHGEGRGQYYHYYNVKVSEQL